MADTPSANGAVAPQRWRLSLGLFAATLLSVFVAGAIPAYPKDAEFSALGLLRNLHLGWSFAVPLMAILVTHEFGHYIAARIHRVPASLPYFIPLPIGPFGTLGAIISMPERIRSRNALLDIGAAGPLAGMVVAIPVIVIGLMQSPVQAIPDGPGAQEGQSLLYLLIKWLVLGPIPEGHDVFLSPTAFAGWAGLLVTALNLLPIGQLDGGHIAYALFGPKQDRVADVLQYGLIAAFLYNVVMWREIAPGAVWLVWFVLLRVLRRASGGANHPPTEQGELSAQRKLVALGCLVLFILLFMPTPLRIYGMD